MHHRFAALFRVNKIYRNSFPATRRSKNVQYWYESLESRRMLAGDVQVSIQNHFLRVIGDEAANEIKIVGTADGIQIRGLDTTINGSTDLFELNDPFKHLFIQMNGGDDVTTVQSLNVQRVFEWQGNDGADELRVFHVTAIQFETFLGNGNDQLELEDITTIREFRVHMGAGDDMVSCRGIGSGGDLKIWGDAGNDILAADDFFAKRKLHLDMGTGDDQALFGGTVDVYKTSNISLGAGDDLLAIVPAQSHEQGHFRKRLNVSADSGNDNLIVDGNTTFQSGFKFRGGKGVDAVQSLSEPSMTLPGHMRIREVESYTIPNAQALIDAVIARLAAQDLNPYDVTPASILKIDPATQFVTVDDSSPTVSVSWDQAIQAAVVKESPGPTIASRAYAMVHTAMYDAWSAYNLTATSTVMADQLQRPESEDTDSNKAAAMSYAAYQVVVDLFPNQTADFAALMSSLGYELNTTTDVTTPAGIGNVMAQELLTERHADGSNQLGTDAGGTSGVAYSDTTSYEPANPVGNVLKIDRWTPEYVPIDADPADSPASEKFLTPQWGSVTSFGLESGSSVRPNAPQSFLLVDGTVNLENKTITLADGSVVSIDSSIVGSIINPAFIEQAQEIVDYSANLTDKQKIIAEFWEDGGGTSFPPGTWMTFGEFVSARDDHTIDEDARMFFSLANAVFDAGIATWEAKQYYDYARPVRTIRELGELGLIGEFDSALGGYAINAWVQNQGTQKILASEFSTYQTPDSNSSPPFAEYSSGHSAFSAAGAEILRRFTGSDVFGASLNFAAGESRFEPFVTPTDSVTLAWDTFTSAADEAGVSRLYGGIHFSDGDLQGRALGKSVGELVWNKSNFYINGGIV